MHAPLLQCRDLRCRRPLWRDGASEVRSISADFGGGQFHAVCGPDGCGRNLFLHLLGLLEAPDGGEVLFDGGGASGLPVAERDALRQRGFGFLFPACALFPSLSIIENIALPVLKAGGHTDDDQAELTLRALQFCGLEGGASRPVAELSPSEQALAALARAIVHRPRVLIAESPAEEGLLVPLARRAVDEWGLTVVWGARENSPAGRAADRRLTMSGGELMASAE